MNPIVLDASLTLAWFFPEEHSEAAEAALRQVGATTLLVPALWPHEVAHGIVIGSRRRRVPPDSVEAFLALLCELAIQVQPESFPEQIQRLVTVASVHGLTAYDAAYLELALRHGAMLASLDGELRRAAHKAGVRILPEQMA